MNLVEHFRRLFAGRRPALTGEEAERLRAEFSARYKCFNDLLSANRRAMGAIAEMELADAGQKALSMSMLRRSATEAMVSVLRMIQNLQALAPDRYPGLEPCFSGIQNRLEKVLGPSAPIKEGPLVLPLDKLDQRGKALAGPKMASLGRMAGELGLPVPAGVVITTAAYHLLLKHNDMEDEIARRLQLADLDRTDGLFAACSEIQKLFLISEIPGPLSEAVEQGLRGLAERQAGPVRLALRSSAWGEDEGETSFAGQFASELNVDPAHWAEAYLQVVASLYSPQALTYRMHAGLRDDEAAMAVGCQVMVGAVAGGVIYTANPMQPESGTIYVESCWGLPKAVVDGAWDCDQFEVDPGPPMRIAARRVAHKPKRYACDPREGVLPEALSLDKAGAPSLTDGQILELAGYAHRLAQRHGCPQDLEWALDKSGKPFILQCRPLPGLQPVPSAALPLDEEKLLQAGGFTASPGHASGPLRWVRGGADAVAFRPGEILALEQPLARWASLLGRAAALVSVSGGMVGHLASVAREFGVPALLGLGPGCRELSSGKVVTVDASGRAVYDGALQCSQAEPGPAAKPDSPLRRTLKEVMRLSARLNLLDPDAPDFTPQACQTLHDLTRFCHQKAVEEMFSQAAREHFPLNAARRLFYKVPMQWWVLDLGGGVAAEADGKYVRLEQITCLPFHAFWQGLTEVAWEGPPAADARGMASVMFQATANPALGGASKGRLADSNYFLLTREFMNLQSRVGVHFSSLEACATGRRPENFVSFCFRGGAADTWRRTARLVFLEEFMARLGMESEIKGDALLARAEDLADPEALSLVKALGYLTMHTRQLDMIMANPGTVEHYRQKLRKGLDSLRPVSPIPGVQAGGASREVPQRRNSVARN